MKIIYTIILLTITAYSTKGQVICYESFDSLKTRLSNLIIASQEIDTEPNYYDHKEYIQNNIKDTVILYTVEHKHENKFKEQKIFNGKDTLKITSPVINEYLRVAFTSQPNSFSEYLLPENNGFDICEIKGIDSNHVYIHFSEKNMYSIHLTLPIPN